MQLDFNNAGILVFGERHRRIYVSKNGIISFGNRYRAESPKNLDLLRNRRSFVAPFWTRQDVRSFGSITPSVYYKECYRYSGSNTQADIDILNIATSDVQVFANLPSFKASWVLLVTWDQVSLEPIQWYSASNNTYQVALVTDGEISVALFNYGDMFGSDLINSKVYMGYYDYWSGQQYSPYMSGTSAMHVLDRIGGNVDSTKNYQGRWWFRLDSNDDDAINYGQKCLEWAAAEDAYIAQVDRIQRSNIDCPCGWRMAFLDRRFRVDSNSDYFRGGDRICYNRRFPIRRGLLFGSGISCCYDIYTWGLITYQPYAGSWQSYHPRYSNRHLINDVLPKEWCCDYSSNCDIYYYYRPIRDCSSYVRPRWGFTEGDPHVTSLDGLKYTFNGLGEFIMVDTPDQVFQLQARTERVPNKNDTGFLNATIYTAFAARDNDSDTVHIEMGPNKTDVIAYVNNRLVENFDTEFTNVELTLDSNQSITASFASGFSLTVTVSAQNLGLGLIVPPDFQNLTRGLMGPYNGDQSDDFTYPNRTVLPPSVSDREKFYYGMTWAIEKISSSLFNYKPGETLTSFIIPGFVPVFMDELNITSEMNRTCGGDAECLFDFAVTGDLSVGLATKETAELNEKIVVELANTPPTLTGTSKLNATVNVTQTIKFVASDADGDNITVNVMSEAHLPPGFSFTSKRGAQNVTVTISWTPEGLNGTLMKFVAIDSKNVSSLEHIVTVQLSPSCQNGGVSAFASDVISSSSKSIYPVTCTCATGWEGAECTINTDGCSDSPCEASGTNCTDLTPTQEQAQGTAYECGPCQSGFEKYDSTCIDIDECQNATLNNCSQTCINKVDGKGYECACPKGYSLVGQFNCQDVDECQLNNPCTQVCNNEVGSYKCDCYHGYKLMGDKVTCKLGINETLCSANNLTCGNFCIWNQTSKDFGCGCELGYRLATDNVTCEDVNECDNASMYCDQHCNNTIGGYTCSCSAGYKLADDTKTCKPCDALHWGTGCANLCECGGRAAVCNASVGCTNCTAGWTGDQCSLDVDECQQGACSNHSVCTNIQGSYSCTCKTGFIRSSGHVCVDQDECAAGVSTCSPNAKCTNTVGNYTCTCSTGYNGNGSTCLDIDECYSAESCHSNATCTNVQGSYKCQCNAGYRGNGFDTCTDIDECQESNDCHKQATCNNNDGSYKCSCNAGYEGDGNTCTNIDECFRGICHPNATCTDTPGSYECFCKKGFTGNGTLCENINECAFNTSNQCHANATCTDTIGNYTCACTDGFEGDGWSCVVKQTTVDMTTTTFTATEGVSTVSQAGTTSQESTTMLQELTTTSQESTTMSQELTTMSQNLTTLSQESTTMSPESTTTSQESTTVPQESSTTSQESNTSSQESSTTSQEVTTLSQESTTMPQESTTTSQESITTSQESTTIPQESTTTSEESTTTSRIVVSTNDTTSSNDTVAMTTQPMTTTGAATTQPVITNTSTTKSPVLSTNDSLSVTTPQMTTSGAVTTSSLPTTNRENNTTSSVISSTSLDQSTDGSLSTTTQQMPTSNTTVSQSTTVEAVTTSLINTTLSSTATTVEVGPTDTSSSKATEGTSQSEIQTTTTTTGETISSTETQQSTTTIVSPTEATSSEKSATTAATSTSKDTIQTTVTAETSTAPSTTTSTSQPAPTTGLQVSCAAKPCQNSGTCSDTSGGYTCQCTADRTGTNCEKGKRTFEGKMTLEQVPCDTSWANNASSPQYRTISTAVVAGLDAAYKSSAISSYSAAEVLSIACGSVIPTYNLIFGVTDQQTLTSPSVEAVLNSQSQLTVLLDALRNSSRASSLPTLLDGLNSSLITGITLSDFNECTAGAHDCSTHANCTNRVGTFTCSCKRGFADENQANSGRICTGQCEASGTSCQNGGSCIEVRGNSTTCACVEGYRGDKCEERVLPGWAIALIVVGVVVLVLSVAVFIMCIYLCRRDRNNSSTGTSFYDDYVPYVIPRADDATAKVKLVQIAKAVDNFRSNLESEGRMYDNTLLPRLMTDRESNRVSAERSPSFNNGADHAVKSRAAIGGSLPRHSSDAVLYRGYHKNWDRSSTSSPDSVPRGITAPIVNVENTKSNQRFRDNSGREYQYPYP